MMVSRETIIHARLKRHDKLRRRSEVLIFAIILLGMGFVILSVRSGMVESPSPIEWTPTEIIVANKKTYDRRLQLDKAPKPTTLTQALRPPSPPALPEHAAHPNTSRVAPVKARTISKPTTSTSRSSRKTTSKPVNASSVRASTVKTQTPEKIKYVEGPHFPALSGSVKDLPPSLAAYIRWHSTVKRTRAAVPTLVWGCRNSLAHACNGLGDRLRGIEFGLMLAIITRRFFIVDWPADPYPLSHAMAPALIDWRPPSNMSALYDSFGFAGHPSHSPLWLHWEATKRNKSAPRWEIAEDDIGAMFGRVRNVILYSTMHSVPVLQRNARAMKAFGDMVNMPTDQVEGALMRALFQPAKDTAAQLHKLFPPVVLSKGVTAVHVRTGRDFNEQETSVGRFKGLRSNEDILAGRVLNCTQRSFSLSSGSFVFLASDSVAFKDSFAQACKRRGVHLVYSKVPALHVGLSDGWKKKKVAVHQTRTAFLNVFVEFFGIAVADRVISNGSYFSRMASVFGNASKHAKVRAKLGIC